jgi:hypothetical protein
MYIIETPKGFVGGLLTDTKCHYVSEPDYAFVFTNLFQARNFLRKHLKNVDGVMIQPWF